MKLVLLKYKRNEKLSLNYFVEEETLFTDIPTLGIAFTCVDNWCHDNNRNVVTINDIDFGSEIVINTTRNNIAKDEYDIIFKIKND